MKISQKFIFYLFFVFALIFWVNIFSLKYFSVKYLDEYLTSIKKQTPDVNYELLTSFIGSKDFDEATIDEYRRTLKDLSELGSSIHSLADNPTQIAPWVLDSLQKIWVPSESIEHVIAFNTIQSFLGNLSNFSFLQNNSPEWIFVTKVFKSVLYINGILILLLFLFTYLWIQFLFRPVIRIVENIKSIVHKKIYSSIEYTRKDEFLPLIESINLLNKNLALQETIRLNFLSDISHEIKTPITAIKCTLEGIQDNVIKLNEATSEHLLREIDRLIRITQTIMEFDELQRQEIDSLKLRKFDIIPMIASMEQEYQALLKKSSQKIRLPSNQSFFLTADRDQMTQILHNIFSNFIKYAGKGTVLQIRCFIRKNNLHLIFEDNGKWVEETELPLLREKFYRVEKSRTNSLEHGMGIGLSIIEKIISLHWGSVFLESQPKKGFIVKIILPR